MRAFRDRFIALVCALGMLAAVMNGRPRRPYEDALVHFTAIASTRRSKASRKTRSLQRSSACRDADRRPAGGALLFSAEGKRVFIKDKSTAARCRNRRTVCRPRACRPGAVRLNNRLRGIVQAALGSLT